MAKKGIDVGALAKQQAERQNNLRETADSIKNGSESAAVETRGRKPKYTADNPKHNMTLALTEDAWVKIKVVAAQRKTTPSQMVLDFINSLE